MSTHAPHNPGIGTSALKGAPTTTAAPGHLVTGAGFLPEHDVTIRVANTGDDVIDYLTYTAGEHCNLWAALPSSYAGASRIAVTDRRPNPDEACGQILWSPSAEIAWPDIKCCQSPLGRRAGQCGRVH